MSIEEKLRAEFRRRSEHVHAPVQPRAKVLFAFRNDALHNRHPASQRKRGSMGRHAVIWIAALAILAGFTYGGGKLLFHQQIGLWGMELRSGGEGMDLDKEMAREIYSSVQSVREQLQPGESAFVYLDVLAKSSHPLYRSLPIVGVRQPERITDRHQLEELLMQNGIRRSMPFELPRGFEFEYAYEGMPVLSPIGTEGMRLKTMLRDEIEATGKRVAWMRIEMQGQDKQRAYTWMYAGSANARLSVTAEAISRKEITYNGIVPDTAEVEEIEINGAKGLYTSNERYPFAESLYYQELSWTRANEDEIQIVYRIGTDSRDVTREELLEIARYIEQEYS